jgi:hypothetical protein
MRLTIRLAAAATSMLLIAAAAPASGCSYPLTAPNTPAHNVAFAERMVDAATFIDVVEVQDEAPFFDRTLWRAWYRKAGVTPPKLLDLPNATFDALKAVLPEYSDPLSARYKLRVVRRLKGASPDVIGLTGRPSKGQRRITYTAPQPPLEHPRGAMSPFDRNQRPERSIDNLVRRSSCSQQAISFLPGAQYLMFRGADGHLLGPVTFGDGRTVTGYTVIELAPGGPADWLAAVAAVAAAAGG